MIRTLPGLENCVITEYAYAIEYDAIEPTQLYPSLETRLVEGLYCAGQINGTSGYEEAAGQGLIAGINAVLKIQGKQPLILRRDEAYIGVMIDDLITKGTEEPYRMFTSRAEYRILLRQDNADIRLTEIGNKIGLASDERLKVVELKNAETLKLVKLISETSGDPEKINPILDSLSSAPIKQKVKLNTILTRPDVYFEHLKKGNEVLEKHIENLMENHAPYLVSSIEEQAEILIKYEGYIDRESNTADKLIRLDYVKIPEDIDYSTYSTLSTESREKLNKIRPETIGQASRISGIKP
jgi:tRNA uridine 5-carboxymethylaminomethyl modification enzyme